MDSTWMETRSSGLRDTSMTMDTSTSNSPNYSSRSEYIPTWKMPISKSFSYSTTPPPGDKSSSESGIGSGGERDTSTSSEPESLVDALKYKRDLKEDESQIIQILLPCIICSRTFAPEALERHSKVCTKVNVKTPYKPDRGKFESAEQRKKGTRIEGFIPPPTQDDSRLSVSSFSRGSKNRSSLRGTSCTTSRSTLNSESLHQHQMGLGLGIAPSPLRRQRSVSQSRGERGHSKTPSEYLLYDDHHSEFGSNSEESHPQTIPDQDNSLPSYAKPLARKDECPYCNRYFGSKAFDRHVEYCKDKFVQRQYEIQPVPKEKIEALERQEIRTKYRPIRGSNSCTSLRSVSPAKDFASMAYKLFGLRRTDGTGNLYNNQLSNFKKSNESIANSCYGDYTRGMRRPSPAPSSRGGSNMSVTNKINNLLSKTFQYGQNSSKNNNNNGSSSFLHPMRVNTSSNIPKLAKSTDNLPMMTTSSHYGHVSSSGYGQQQALGFNRNSRSRSSLHKNFFRSSSQRTEPEGTENTGTMTNSSGNSSSPLIITPMTFFSKNNKMSSNINHPAEVYHPTRGSSLSHDPAYDPYAMAAKQLEELLKSQPINKNVNKKTARKLGLLEAFHSVGVRSDEFPASQNENDVTGNEETFVFSPVSEKMDDNYWDEILQKSSSGVGNRKQEKRETDQTLASETKSQQSDSTNFGDNSNKSNRAFSSADSGFSRSEVNDAEFEALESMVGIGGIPQKSNSKSQSLLSSFHPSLSRNSSTVVKRSISQNQSLSSTEPESPMQISPPPLTSTPLSRRDGHEEPISPSPTGVGARFCHECGNSYPSPVAKFCPECGEKRVFRS